MYSVSYDDVVHAIISMYYDNTTMLSKCMRLLMDCKNFKLTNAIYRGMLSANKCVYCGGELVSRNVSTEYIPINGGRTTILHHKKYCPFCDVILDKYLNT